MAGFGDRATEADATGDCGGQRLAFLDGHGARERAGVLVLGSIVPNHF